MSAQVTAAWIAAGVSAATLVVTSAAQYLSRRGTRRDLKEQRKQLDRTLAEQRLRTLNERFATSAGQLGSDKPAAVRLAGVYAVAGLAEDWKANRQTCVDVLCGYLRLPHDPDPGDADSAKRAAYLADREVRQTIIRVITAHLQAGAAKSWQRWQGLNFDFTGAVFDGGDFDFYNAEFSGGEVNFGGAEFSGGAINFGGAVFSGGTVYFGDAEFSGGTVGFSGAKFSGSALFFSSAEFSSGAVWFNGAEFSGSNLSFGGAEFSGGTVDFDLAKFSGGEVNFGGAEFSGSNLSFGGAEFSGGTVDFDLAKFSGGTVGFGGAKFSGGQVAFHGAEFSGGAVDFSDASDWSHLPEFDWEGTPPPGVKLPKKEDQPPA